MSNKKIKRIMAFEDSINYDIPCEPLEFMKYFQDRFDLVPEEYNDTTHISLESQGLYEYDSTLELVISYERMETDSERDKRDREVQAMIDYTEEQELCKLAQLKRNINVDKQI